MERTAQCHCGFFRIIATGDPDRVYLCHCKACQRRTGTAFHFGATYPKEQVRLDGERKIYERDAETALALGDPLPSSDMAEASLPIEVKRARACASCVADRLALAQCCAAEFRFQSDLLASSCDR
jgi:hypothetical protein